MVLQRAIACDPHAVTRPAAGLKCVAVHCPRQISRALFTAGHARGHGSAYDVHQRLRVLLTLAKKPGCSIPI